MINLKKTCVSIALFLSTSFAHGYSDEGFYGGYSMGLGGGVAVTGSSHVIRVNPSLMSYFREYAVDLDYVWPEYSRSFYSLSVIDSITSDVAVGAQYQAAKTKYQELKNPSGEDRGINQRFTLGFSKVLSGISLGISGQYTSRYKRSEEQEVGRVTLGAGAALSLGSNFRLGLSVENLGNSKFEDTNPTKFRFGVSSLLLSNNLSLQLEVLKAQKPLLFQEKDEYEDFATLSFITRARDVVRLLGYYSEKISNTDLKESSYGAGIGIGQQNFSLSYFYQRTKTNVQRDASSVNLRIKLPL